MIPTGFSIVGIMIQSIILKISTNYFKINFARFSAFVGDPIWSLTIFNSLVELDSLTILFLQSFYYKLNITKTFLYKI